MISLKEISSANSLRRPMVLIVGVALSTMSVGCGGGDTGPARAAVEGVVTLDGQKLKEGVVRFIPSAKGKNLAPATMAAVKDGLFQLPRSEGPVVGTHRVEIESTGHFGFEIDDEAAYAKSFQENKGKALPPSPIPEIYNSKSTLSAEVKASGENKFEFPLQAVSKE